MNTDNVDKISLLTESEIDSVSGAIIPFVIAAAAALGGGYAAGYVVGRGLAYLSDSE